ncbi:Anaerobic glycerol-3-phosphate dehydrogenase subunit C [Cedecea lapagei]|uniref:Anaerobic glycerol-3-phosphate dehydrogenase subunit C n=1 Tax=Cedecea lapagei TaxID=158823 RepID=A0A3S5DPK9_9ENTR|nr:Anaerobic glycerol-3-phosphate dehydrogenase subunit C [Cedecea lapagei]
MNLLDETSFESCIKCTVCTTACPVSRVRPEYPGPKQAGPDGERLRLKDPSLYDDALKYCTNCKRCEVSCPSEVKIGDIIQRARAKYGEHSPSLRDAILSHTDLMGTLSTPFAPLVNATTGLKPVRKLLDKALNIDSHRELPKYSFGTFRQWYRRQAGHQASLPQQVAFFHGCFVNYNHPQLGKDMVKVLNAMGIGVQLLKREKCCGVPLIANGFIEKAKKTGDGERQLARRSRYPPRASGRCHLINLYLHPAR